jgi:hypothetical protein
VLLIGSALNMALNGLFFVQLAIYFAVLADSDPLFLRIIVHSFSILDIFQTGMHFHFIHRILRILVLIPYLV